MDISIGIGSNIVSMHTGDKQLELAHINREKGSVPKGGAATRFGCIGFSYNDSHSISYGPVTIG